MALRTIDKLVVHHSASSSVTTKKSDLERWRKERGFLEIGYHKVIERDGKVADGRDEGNEGAHARGANSHSLGVCVVGDLEVEIPTSAQIAALESVLVHWCRQYGLTDAHIYGHTNVPGGTTNTLCPGKNLASRLPIVKANIRAALKKTGGRAP